MNTRIEKGAILFNKTGYIIPVYEGAELDKQVEQIEPNESFVLISGGEIAPYTGTKCWAMTPRKEGCIVLFEHDLKGLLHVGNSISQDNL